MSKILGIVAEYNPFHNGHLYHLQRSKEKCGADYVVAVMSGNFAQRGNTSIVNKWAKAQMALENGVDLVLELPTVYSVSSAENFAEGAVKLLNNLGIIDNISFGTETGDIAALNNIANILVDEPKEFVDFLKEELDAGNSFPKARENAIINFMDNNERYKNILNTPNNILAVEYLKSLKKIKSNIEPISVKREKVYYNDEHIVDGFASASAIRKMLINGEFSELTKVVPRSCYDILQQEYQKGNMVFDMQMYEKEIFYVLRKMSVEEIADLPDVSEGLENTIKNAVCFCNNIRDFINIVKSKRYTQTRIQRILLFALLGITKKDVQASKRTIPYARVLGFNPKGKILLSGIANKIPKVELITSVKKFMDKNINRTYKRMAEIDIMATNIYTLAYKTDSMANLDYTKNMVMIDQI